MKKTIAIILLILVNLSLFAGDYFDVSLGFGHYTDFKKANSLSLASAASLLSSTAPFLYRCICLI